MSGKMSNKVSNPIHPGEVFRDEIIKKNNLTATYTAFLLNMTPENLSTVINARHGLTMDMCHRIGIVFDEDPKKWAMLQMEYDLNRAEESAKKARLKPFIKPS
jgi:antitoxin HigA-1